MVLTIQRDDVVRGGLGLGVRAVAASSWPTAAARGGTGWRRRALMVVAQGLHANRATAMLMGRRSAKRSSSGDGCGVEEARRDGSGSGIRRWRRRRRRCRLGRSLARRRAAEKARRGRAQGGPPAGRDKQGPDPAGVRTKASSGGRAWRQGRREETGRTWRGREAQGPKGATAAEVGGHGAAMSA